MFEKIILAGDKLEETICKSPFLLGLSVFLTIFSLWASCWLLAAIFKI